MVGDPDGGDGLAFGLAMVEAVQGIVRWIRKGEVRENSFAAQCYRKQSVPDQLAPVPASAWLYEKGLQEGAQIWEQSVGLKNYGAVLSLLVIVEPVEKGK